LFTLNWTLTDYCQYSLTPNVLFNDAVSPYGHKGLNVSQHDVTKQGVYYFGHIMFFRTQLFRRCMSPSLSIMLNIQSHPLQIITLIHSILKLDINRVHTVNTEYHRRKNKLPIKLTSHKDRR